MPTPCSMPKLVRLIRMDLGSRAAHACKLLLYESKAGIAGEWRCPHHVLGQALRGICDWDINEGTCMHAEWRQLRPRPCTTCWPQCFAEYCCIETAKPAAHCYAGALRLRELSAP